MTWGESLGQRGHSKDHRPDLPQMVVGIALDFEGRPICCEMWPGNTADVKSFLPVVERMRARFRVREMCVVADRGMISEATIEAFGAMDPPVHYSVGVRMRRTKEVGEVVLKSRAPWQEVTGERQRAKDPAPLKVKEVKIEGREYVVCLNEEERRKDAHPCRHSQIPARAIAPRGQGVGRQQGLSPVSQVGRCPPFCHR